VIDRRLSQPQIRHQDRLIRRLVIDDDDRNVAAGGRHRRHQRLRGALLTAGRYGVLLRYYQRGYKKGDHSHYAYNNHEFYGVTQAYLRKVIFYRYNI